MLYKIVQKEMYEKRILNNVVNEWHYAVHFLKGK